MKKPNTEFDREFEHYLQRISRFLRKIILRSDEFRELRVLLKQGKAEMRLFLVPVLFQAGQKKGRRKQTATAQFKLTEADKRFLKKVGIRF